jgi:hypothetical protein
MQLLGWGFLGLGERGSPHVCKALEGYKYSGCVSKFVEFEQRFKGCVTTYLLFFIFLYKMESSQWHGD